MAMRKILFYPSIFCASTFLSSCGHVSQTNSDECRIYGDVLSTGGELPRRFIVIEMLDGESFRNSWIDRIGLPEVSMKPGRHSVQVYYAAAGSYMRAKFSIDAESGHSYVVKRSLTGYTAKLWIEDAKSGALVSTPSE